MTSSTLPFAEPVLPVPRGRGAWATVAIVILALTVSSVAPFVQLAPGGPSLTSANLGSAAIYILTWIPFVALAAALTGGAWFRGQMARWTAHLAFLLIVPALHALLFVLLMDRLDPGFTGPTGLADPRVRVLALLGTLQYLVVISVLLAVFAGRAASRERARVAELELKRAIPEAPAPARRIAVRQDGRVVLVSPSDIDWVKALGNYVELHGRGGALRHRATMAEMEEALGPAFIRIRRSVLVRTGAIRYCEPWGKGSWVVVLADQTKLTSSRYYRERLQGLLGE